MNEHRYCFGCMKPLTWDGKCTSCDFDRDSYQEKPHHLPLGTMLHGGEYMVGRVLGEGGFGITYIGLHQNLLIPVAIKEYFPNGMVWRKCEKEKQSYSVVPFTAESEQQFDQGKKDFLREARVLSQFGFMDGIVRTRTFFEENNTAYLVMDYIEGDSVKKYVTENGRVTPEVCRRIMRQPMLALMKMHESNLVHQDVSPDNIIINAQGRGVLIDFGAVRHANAIDDRTRTAIYKQGFSAYEQLEKKGGRGPWTDVYGFCATIYYMLSGEKPLDATERVFNDRLVPLTEYVPELDPQVDRLLMKGLAVESTSRLQRLDELYDLLYESEEAEYWNGEATGVPEEHRRLPKASNTLNLTMEMERRLQEMEDQRARRKRNKTILTIVLSAAVVVGIVILLAWIAMPGRTNGPQRQPAVTADMMNGNTSSGASPDDAAGTATADPKDTANASGSADPENTAGAEETTRPEASKKPKKTATPKKKKNRKSTKATKAPVVTAAPTGVPQKVQATKKPAGTGSKKKNDVKMDGNLDDFFQ